MLKHNQDGAVNGLVVSLILAVLLLIGASGFGYWAYSGRQDYKNNVDAKINKAVEKAVSAEDKKLNAQFAENYKKPLQLYQGPEAYGSLKISFPKTWSGYVDDIGDKNPLVDGYFAPGTVPSLTNENAVFALRVQVTSQTYAQTLDSLSGQQQDGKVTVSAYTLPRLPKTVGVKAVGQIKDDGPTSTMVIMPLRSQTLQIWTEGSQYLNDFNNYILPNFSFSP